ncbi:glucoamylase [bacterium SCGC AG-212-C10]|nr:glucoamylase [bacterium SCGC AG-212-C10]
MTRIEDYALIGDSKTAALVGSDGSIDWLCVPRFDSGACFARLLGDQSHGRWLLAPAAEPQSTRRRYRPNTLILETEFTCEGGVARVTDFMPIHPKGDRVDVVRLVSGVSGTVDFQLELVIRFDYGLTVPWVRKCERGIVAIAGPNALELGGPVTLHGEGLTTRAEFTVAAGEVLPFTLTWFRSSDASPSPLDEARMLEDTERWWTEWASGYQPRGHYDEAIIRSLITLKALTYRPTGGIVAAPTTSLPEEIGGVRNWDYRYCWLRDATFTLYAFMNSGLVEESHQWCQWLKRAIAGAPAQAQIMYGVAGERLLPEIELPWLPGYENSAPVRIGNAASHQLQLDIYGEVMDLFHVARRHGVQFDDDDWAIQRRFLEFLEEAWDEPDWGIWETRGPARHYTHSKVMVWVAFDRAVKAVERHGLSGPVERWRVLRDRIHADVCREGYDASRNTFVQFYGGQPLDAAALMFPLVGFLPATDSRIVGTLEAIRSELMVHGLVRRYSTDTRVDGVPGDEGVFLTCSFWFVDNLALMQRYEEAEAMFERLLAIRNDLGLLAEEYDPVAKRQLGNFPQALSHLALINSAHNLQAEGGPARGRAEC